MNMFRNEVILRASPIRRGFAVAVLGALGALLLAMGIQARAPLVPWAFGAIAIYMAYRLYAATKGGLRLSDAGIETLEGELIAPMDQIQRVDRGAFAFKPSNGFLLRLSDKSTGRWAPGLWWRMGRSVGVGGVTSAGAAKAMAEEIALRIARR